jgi:hypothetical protein
MSSVQAFENIVTFNYLSVNYKMSVFKTMHKHNTVNSRYNEFRYNGKSRYNESYRSPLPKIEAYKELIRIFVTTKFPL